MSRLAHLADIIDRLRGPDGCPWDQAQTWASMRPYLLEECHEVLDAIDQGDPAAVQDELGDLLFVVLLIARMGEDLPDRSFGIEAVARGVADKMVRRHPHVFAGRDRPAGPGIEDWERQKAREGPGGQPRSRMAGVPRSLPALLRTHRQTEKAASVGFDWPDAAGVLDKVDEELGELREALEHGIPGPIEHEYGDLLMALGSLGRHIGAAPESALRRANDRFSERFRSMEAAAWDSGRSLSDLDDAALDELWEAAKANPSLAPEGV